MKITLIPDNVLKLCKDFIKQSRIQIDLARKLIGPSLVDITVPTDNVAYYAAKITPIIGTVMQPMRHETNTVGPLHDYTAFSISGKQPAPTLLKTLSDEVGNQSSINIPIPMIRPSVRYCF
jgi:hypothetical protein